jgi:hypothetical protein
MIMVFNAIFNHISATPFSTIFQLHAAVSFLLVQETGVPGENHQPVAITDKLFDIKLY